MTHTHTQTHIHTYIHTCKHTRAHTHIHTLVQLKKATIKNRHTWRTHKHIKVRLKKRYHQYSYYSKTRYLRAPFQAQETYVKTHTHTHIQTL